MRRLALLAWLIASGAAADVQALPPLFVTAERCMACHNGLVTPSGEDVSIGRDWRASIMAHSALDPYWRASVRREVLEHPAAQASIEDECSVCHMPMAHVRARKEGRPAEIFRHVAPADGRLDRVDRLALDGVSCSLCHQIEAEGLGDPGSYTGGFSIPAPGADGARSVFGPFAIDPGRRAIMRSASGYEPREADHLQRSELCATCHTLYTHALGEGGEVVGRLPEQVPYLEWLHSDYRGRESCQDCHMPVVEAEMPVTSVFGEPRAGLSRHVFRGGNFFMQRMLARYGDELGVTTPTPELLAAADRTARHLQGHSAEVRLDAVRLEGGRLEARVTVRNLAGHKLPTAYPSRRAWIHLTVRGREGEVAFESGRFTEDGAIVGNDNDRDPRRYERHHRVVERPDQVQIYEAIMVEPDGQVTTGLLSAVRFVKDNRLLPEGFVVETAVDDVAVKGLAREDPDFAGGGDAVRYSVPVDRARGPFRVVAELWYQPIAYRWALNLAPFDAEETQRFVAWYRSMASGSALVLARDGTVTP